MKTFFIADPHFGHFNMTKAGRDLCGRPFHTVAEMNDQLITNINAVVKYKHRLVIQGDICMGDMEASLKALSRLECGELVLMPGNHDRWSPAYHTKGKTPMEKELNRESQRLRYEEISERMYADVIALKAIDMMEQEDGTFEIEPITSWSFCQLSDEWKGHPLDKAVFSHFPVSGESHMGREDRYKELRPNTTGPVIHGHVHTEWKTKGNQFNVGVDVNDFKPVDEDELVAWIESL